MDQKRPKKSQKRPKIAKWVFQRGQKEEKEAKSIFLISNKALKRVLEVRKQEKKISLVDEFTIVRKKGKKTTKKAKICGK